MSKAEEKTTELMKKAKDFIPDGGYSEKELNLAFFMFIKGYYQAEKDLELTWEDISKIISIDQQICGAMGISDYIHNHQQAMEEVLKRFNEQRNEDKH